MTHYIYGNTGAEYTIFGIRIPKKSHTESEVKRGKKPYTAVNDFNLTRLMNDRFFLQMFSTGKVTVTQIPPADVAAAKAQEENTFVHTQAAIALEKKNAELKAELRLASQRLAEKDRLIDKAKADK